MAIRGKNMVDVKQSNRRAILNLLHEEGGLSRKQLAVRLNLTPAAITMIVGDLIAAGVLREGMVLTSNGVAGRREITLDMDDTFHVALGLSINIDETILSAVSLSGELLVAEKLAGISGADADDVVNRLAQSLAEFRKRDVLSGKQVIGLGVSVRGIVNGQDGISVDTLGLLRQTNYPIREAFEKATQLRVTVNNNVRGLAQAQQFLTKGDAGGNMLFVRAERGIGAALILDYKLYEGMRHRSAEIGHITVEKGGRPCTCGGHGCLETVASMPAILTDAAACLDKKATPALHDLTGGDPEKITFAAFSRAANAGDKPLAGIWDKAVDVTAVTLRSAVKLLDLQRIVLYGMMFEDERYMQALKARIVSGDTFGISPDMLHKSALNLMLDSVAAPILAVSDFFYNGANLA